MSYDKKSITLEGEYTVAEASIDGDFSNKEMSVPKIVRGLAQQTDMFEHEHIVYERNEFALARYDQEISLLSNKIISVLMAKINRNADKFEPINLTKPDIARLTGVSVQFVHREFEKSIYELKALSIRVPYIDKDWEMSVLAEKLAAEREGRKPRKIPKPKKGDNSFAQASVFEDIPYNDSSGFLTLKFNSRLKDYLLDINCRYTYYHLKMLSFMTSNYAYRLYRVLRGALSIKEVESGIVDAYRDILYEDLRDFLQVPKESYQGRFYDFERAVLKTAQRNFEKTDLRFDWSLPERKFGRNRKITFIRFHIKAKEVIPLIEYKEDDWKLIYDQYFLNTNEHSHHEHDENLIKRNVNYFKEQVTNGNEIRKPRSWLRKSFNEDFAAIEHLKKNDFGNEIINSFCKTKLVNTWSSFSKEEKEYFLENGFGDKETPYIYASYKMFELDYINKKSKKSTRSEITKNIMDIDNTDW